MKISLYTAAALGLLVGSVGLAQAQQAGSVLEKADSATTINSNQAVATTDANASTPAKGANSFTMGEAKSRLETGGFSNIGDLTKDDDGVWRGQAQKGGNTTTVWLDYKGNFGQSN